MGAFVSTHGKSIDDVDKAILEAKYVYYFSVFLPVNVLF